MKMGDAIRQEVDQLIRIQDKLLMVLSKFSIESSWIQRELQAALTEEKNQNRAVLFPLRLDNSGMDGEKKWMTYLQQTHSIYDFVAWENWEAYYNQFYLLVKDLKSR